ncbi:hypothetical protein M9Y10_036302 [Tritrichomonas musculus]|uniref:Exportin-1 C-terminal domain-containing protein n=1 Tax=Tritrichomonas musculus TaxID=1915356 RepID=A0ABR2GV02_9EUKA
MDIIEFENLINQPPNLDETSYSQIFKSDPSNIANCKDYLENEKCTENLQIFLSSTILDFVKKANEMNNLMQLNQNFQLCDWCLNILELRHDFLAIPTIKTISTIFSNIIYYLYDINMNAKLNEITRLAKCCPFCELSIINETIFIFSTNYESFKNTKDSFRESFSKKLNTFFEIASEFIARGNNQIIIEVSLQIIFQCICYGEIDYFSSSIDDSKHKFNSPREVTDLLNPDTIDMLFDVYFKTHETCALQSLCCILKMQNSAFQSGSSYFIDSIFRLDSLGYIIESYTNNFNQLFSSFLKIENPDLPLITEIIYSYSQKLKDKFVCRDKQLDPSFIQALNLLFQFCSALYESDNPLKEHLNIYTNLMNFWGHLSNVFLKKLNCYEPIFDLINKISSKYTSFLITLILSDDLEIIEEIINEDDLLYPYKLLIASSGVDTFSLVLNIFAQYLSTNNSQLLPAFFLKLSSIVLEQAQTNILQGDMLNRKVSIFNLSLKIIESTTKLLETNQAGESPILECTVLIFIEKIQTYSIDDLLPQLYYKILTGLIKRVILSLQSFDDNDQVIERANIALNSILPIKYPDTDDYFEYKKTCFEFLHNFQNFPFFQNKDIQNFTQERNKMMFISAVYFLSYKFGCLIFVNNFLNGLLEANDIENLLFCLNGILIYRYEAIPKHKIVPLLFDWLFPKNVTFLVAHGKNPNENLHILKFWKKLLKIDLVELHKHSDFGITVFEAVSETIIDSINFYLNVKNEMDDQIRFQLLRLISSCSAYLLGRKYIMFEAFKIYSSPVHTNFLNALITFCDNSNFNDTIKYSTRKGILINFFVPLLSVIINNESHLNLLPISFFVYAATFYENLISKPQIPKKDFCQLFLNLVRYVNYSKRNDIIEIKKKFEKCFIVAFCFTCKEVINRRMYEYCTIIKELIVYNPSFVDVLRNNMALVVNDKDAFLNLFNEFLGKMPELLASDLESDFDCYFNKMVDLKDDLKSLDFKE